MAIQWGRDDDVQIVQQPDASNDYTLIVEFFDGFPGSWFYAIELSKTPGCVLNLNVTVEEGATARIQYDVSVQHNREQTVRIPITLVLLDADEQIIETQPRGPFELTSGDWLRIHGSFSAENLEQGLYYVMVTLDGMRAAKFRIREVELD